MLLINPLFFGISFSHGAIPGVVAGTSAFPVRYQWYRTMAQGMQEEKIKTKDLHLRVDI